MISQKQIDEIRHHLDTAENPLFIWDGDTDGLCAFLLLRRHAGKGNYIIARDGPDVTPDLLKQVNEISPDKIFVLDKPLMSQEFIDGANVPIIWLDHHMPVERKGVRYYNPRIENIKHEQCTTYWAYEVVKKDIWIAMMGIVADWRTDYIAEFAKKYPGLIKHKVKIAPDVLYNTELGKLIRYTSFILKGKMKEVRKNVDMMISMTSPYELLNEESEKAKKLMSYAKKLGKNYDSLLKKALENKADDKFFLFLYPNGKHSFTGELSNELIYRMPDKFIIVARQKEDKVIMSLRGNKWFIPGIIDKAKEGLDAYGGGHDHACGAGVPKENFNKFVERIKKLI